MGKTKQVMPQTQMIPVEKLKHRGDNPRTIKDADFRALMEDIRRDPEFFLLRPILVSETSRGMFVYAGDKRLRAAKELGWPEVPCKVEKSVPERVMKRRMVQDNLHRGAWDYELLANEFEIEELELVGFSFPGASGVNRDPHKCTCPTCGREHKAKEEA